MSLTPEQETELRKRAADYVLTANERDDLFATLDAERHARKVAEARVALFEAKDVLRDANDSIEWGTGGADAWEVHDVAKADVNAKADALMALGVEP